MLTKSSSCHLVRSRTQALRPPYQISSKKSPHPRKTVLAPNLLLKKSWFCPKLVETMQCRVRRLHGHELIRGARVPFIRTTFDHSDGTYFSSMLSFLPYLQEQQPCSVSNPTEVDKVFFSNMHVQTYGSSGGETQWANVPSLQNLPRSLLSSAF